MKSNISIYLNRYISIINRTWIDPVRAVLAAGPGVLLLHVALTEPVGHAGWNNRSIAGFFHTLAYLEWGLQAILQIHPEESLSSPFHLHSLLSAPFMAAGIDTGGRLVSLAAMVLAAYWLGGLVTEWRTREAGWLAVALLWLQPWVVQRAYMWVPEALSIALTTGAVYYLVRYYESNVEFGYLASNVLVVLGIATHLWEAIIGLPLVAVSLYYRNVKRAAGSGVVVVMGTVFVWGVSKIQGGGSTLAWWSVWGNWLVFLEPDYWALSSVSTAWSLIGEFAYLPAALLGTLGSFYLWLVRAKRFYAVLAAWLVAGLVIPVVLARGNVHHPYLIWGLVAPVTVGTTVLINGFFTRFGDQFQSVSFATVAIGTLSVLYILSTIYGAGYVADYQHPGVGEYTFADEAQQVGEELHQRGIKRSELTFVGDWYQQYNWGQHGYQSDILFVYAGAKYLPQGRYANLSHPSPNQAHITEDPAEAESEWCILREGDSLTLLRCAELAEATANEDRSSFFLLSNEKGREKI